ncbi:MAG: hypothetical protein V3Q69_00630 [Burkholderia sp.]
MADERGPQSVPLRPHTRFMQQRRINGAKAVDVDAQRSRGQPPIKSDSRVTA